MNLKRLICLLFDGHRYQVKWDVLKKEIWLECSKGHLRSEGWDLRKERENEKNRTRASMASTDQRVRPLPGKAPD